jgi:hypothetical protein
MRIAVALAAAIAFATVTAGALAATTSPALPTRVSLSGNGAPRCTYFPVHTNRSWPMITIVIRRPTTQGTFDAISARYQAQGNGWYKWCGHYRRESTPGSYTWYACMQPTELDHVRNRVSCTTRTPKRWIAVVS